MITLRQIAHRLGGLGLLAAVSFVLGQQFARATPTVDPCITCTCREMFNWRSAGDPNNSYGMKTIVDPAIRVHCFSGSTEAVVCNLGTCTFEDTCNKYKYTNLSQGCTNPNAGWAWQQVTATGNGWIDEVDKPRNRCYVKGN